MPSVVEAQNEEAKGRRGERARHAERSRGTCCFELDMKLLYAANTVPMLDCRRIGVGVLRALDLNNPLFDEMVNPHR
jgi:hypothetical protein